jgi:hypothetical protein
MNAVSAAALRRGSVLAGALAATLAAHALSGGAAVLPVAPALWLGIVAVAVLPGLGPRRVARFGAWGTPRILATLVAVQLATHVALVKAPWALGLVAHHHGPALTVRALALHLGVALALTVLLRFGERWALGVLAAVTAMLSLAPPRAHPRPRAAARPGGARLVSPPARGPRTSRGPPSPAGLLTA